MCNFGRQFTKCISKKRATAAGRVKGTKQSTTELIRRSIVDVFYKVQKKAGIKVVRLEGEEETKRAVRYLFGGDMPFEMSSDWTPLQSISLEAGCF